ncbi:MAG: hypothetical protein EHM35_01035 [Planctomycetaceae bacterium]|nr:MAG: hypothetical protein EHM35_01035 [Planctomycetaceae bacterium]
MTPVALTRRIRTLKMLSRTALTPQLQAVYSARVELAWMHARRQGKLAWQRSQARANASAGYPYGSSYAV